MCFTQWYLLPTMILFDIYVLEYFLYSVKNMFSKILMTKKESLISKKSNSVFRNQFQVSWYSAKSFSELQYTRQFWASFSKPISSIKIYAICVSNYVTRLQWDLNCLYRGVFDTGIMLTKKADINTFDFTTSEMKKQIQECVDVPRFFMPSPHA